MDSEHTRHAEPCVHGEINGDHADDNESQSISVTPLTPSLLPPTQSSRPVTSSALLPINRQYTYWYRDGLSILIALDSTINSDVQATQASVECVALVSEVNNVHETQVSLTNSSSSTNSSNTDGQLTSTDRTELDDDHYGRNMPTTDPSHPYACQFHSSLVQEQKNDLDRITFYEIALSDDRRDDQRDLDDFVQRELDEYVIQSIFDVSPDWQCRLILGGFRNNPWIQQCRGTEFQIERRIETINRYVSCCYFSRLHGTSLLPL